MATLFVNDTKTGDFERHILLYKEEFFFYRGANAICGKIGRLAVALQLIKNKCIPILLYGLEPFDLSNTDLRSLDFVINRFFMKLFKTASMEIVQLNQLSQTYLCFELLSVLSVLLKKELKNLD